MNADGCSNGPTDGDTQTKPSSSSARNRRRRRNKRSKQNSQGKENEDADDTTGTSPPTNFSQSNQNEILQPTNEDKTQRKNTPSESDQIKISHGNQNTPPQTVRGEEPSQLQTELGLNSETKTTSNEAHSEREEIVTTNAHGTAGTCQKEQKPSSISEVMTNINGPNIGCPKQQDQHISGMVQAEGVSKSKSQLKAERRALQEAQRAAKAEKLAAEGKKVNNVTSKTETKLNEKSSAPSQQEQSKGASGQSEEGPTKSKSQLRAERRAIQEAQRAAKSGKLAAEGKNPQQSKKEEGKTSQNVANDKGGKKVEEKKESASARKKSECGGDEDSRVVSSSYHADEVVRVPTEIRHDDPQQVKKKVKRLERQKIFQRAETHKKVALFSHLPQYQIENGVLPNAWKAGISQVHPAFYRVGIQMAYGSIMGANNRCMALAEALTAFIDSFERPFDKEFGRYMESQFSPNVTFLSECRPLSAGMRMFVKNFKSKMLMVGREDNQSDDERKEELKTWIVDFIKEKILLAGKTIAKNASGKISAGSCLLTFAFSSTVAQVFRHARQEESLDFTVIVADCEPLYEGRRMIRFLESAGIPCEYVSLTGVASVMSRVSALFIGAQAIFNNGSVLARAGTGLIATIAEEFHRPLHVCCESYKFWERVQLDSFVYNELGDPTSLIDDGMRDEWENPKSPLHYLNPLYDVTPPELIDIVVTELCLMPSSSVPVVLRRHAI